MKIMFNNKKKLIIVPYNVFIVFILLLLLSLFAFCVPFKKSIKKKQQNAEPKGQANSLKTSRERATEREREGV